MFTTVLQEQPHPIDRVKLVCEAEGSPATDAPQGPTRVRRGAPDQDRGTFVSAAHVAWVAWVDDQGECLDVLIIDGFVKRRAFKRLPQVIDVVTSPRQRRWVNVGRASTRSTFG